MNAILILENDTASNLRILVSITQKKLEKQVISLLDKNRGREAFDLLKSKAEVRAYLPKGSKLPIRPELTLFEDML